jgi:hypothetical protein
MPSVAGQRGADFRWVVFCDDASPEWLKAKVSTFEPLVRAVYIDGPATDEIMAREVKRTGFISSP